MTKATTKETRLAVDHLNQARASLASAANDRERASEADWVERASKELRAVLARGVRKSPSTEWLLEHCKSSLASADAAVERVVLGRVTESTARKVDPQTEGLGEQQFEDQVRFNWGFHDGVQDFQRKRSPEWTSPHYDKVYEAGYIQGGVAASQGQDTSSSAPYWLIHVAVTTPKGLQCDCCGMRYERLTRVQIGPFNDELCDGCLENEVGERASR